MHFNVAGKGSEREGRSEAERGRERGRETKAKTKGVKYKLLKNKMSQISGLTWLLLILDFDFDFYCAAAATKTATTMGQQQLK